MTPVHSLRAFKAYFLLLREDGTPVPKLQFLQLAGWKYIHTMQLRHLAGWRYLHTMHYNASPAMGRVEIHTYIQGGSFNWPSPISIPKRKLPSSQSGPFLVTGFTETAAGIGSLGIFFLVLKLGRAS